MASGSQMLEAVQKAIKDLPHGAVFKLSGFDAKDLYKLEPEQLKAASFSDATIDEVVRELRSPHPSLNKLGAALGVRLVIDSNQKNLIPGEGIRRSMGIWANGDDAVQSMVDEVRMLRNPAG